MTVETKPTDAKGRVTLPKAFANSTVTIEQISDDELRIRKARATPGDKAPFAEERPIILSDRDRQQFLEALDHPVKPNTALRRLMAGKAKKRV